MKTRHPSGSLPITRPGTFKNKINEVTTNQDVSKAFLDMHNNGGKKHSYFFSNKFGRDFIHIDKESGNPFFTLLHETGHRDDIHKNVKNRSMANQLKMERSANRLAVEDIKDFSSTPEKDVKAYGSLAEKNYKTYTTTLPLREAFDGTNVAESLKSRATGITSKAKNPEEIKMFARLARKQVQKESPAFNKALKRIYAINKDVLKLRAI